MIYWLKKMEKWKHGGDAMLDNKSKNCYELIQIKLQLYQLMDIITLS